VDLHPDTHLDFLCTHACVMLVACCLYSLWHGWTLMYEGIEVFWKAEGLYNYEHGLVKTSSTLIIVAEVVKSVANNHMPTTVDHNENSLTVDFYKTLKFIFNTYGLLDVAQEHHVELAVILEGANLRMSLGHATAGI